MSSWKIEVEPAPGPIARCPRPQLLPCDHPLVFETFPFLKPGIDWIPNWPGKIQCNRHPTSSGQVIFIFPPNSGDVSMEEKAIKRVCEKVRALLDNVSLIPQHLLIQKFISLNVSRNDRQLVQIVKIIFDKAVEEPKFSALYAELCGRQAAHDMKKHDGLAAFRSIVMTRTQLVLQGKMDIGGNKLAVIEKEEDLVKREAMIVEEKQKFRRRKFGVMAFIGYLYRNSLMTTRIVQECCNKLFQSILPEKNGRPLRRKDIDEESVYHGLLSVKITGDILDKYSDIAFLDHWFQKLEDVKPLCSEQIRDMINRLMELRRNKWVPVDLARNFEEPEQGAKASVAKLDVSDCALKPIPPADRPPFILKYEGVPMEGFGVKKELAGSQCQETGDEKAMVPVSEPKKSDDPKKLTSGYKLEVSDSAPKPNAPTVPASTRKPLKSWLSKDELAARESIMTSVKSGIQEVIKGNRSMTDMAKTINDYVGNEKYAKPSLTVVYSMIIRAISEKEMDKEERKKLAEVLRMSMTSKIEKQAFIDGAVLMCKCAMDIPNLWIHIAEVLFNMIKTADEPTISLNELGPVFMTNKNKFELFVQIMKLWVEEEIQDKIAVESLPWLFMELSFAEEMIKDGLREEMKLVKMSNGASLADLLIR